MWLENLRRMKSKSGLTTKEIAAKSDIPEPTLEKLFAGKTKDPKLKTMRQLVHFFGYTLDDLDDVPIRAGEKALLYSSEAMQLAADYDSLDAYGKRMVQLVTDEEKARCSASLEPISPVLEKPPVEDAQNGHTSDPILSDEEKLEQEVDRELEAIRRQLILQKRAEAGLSALTDTELGKMA